ALASRPDAEIAAICDVDAQVRRIALRDLTSVQPRVPQVVGDARLLFDDASIDAVVIATPDHSHTPLAVAACEAGKDVYLEAPVTHSRDEASRLLSAAEGRVVQCGLQQRSGDHFRSAIDLIRSGGIGRVGLVRAWAVHRRGVARNDASQSLATVDDERQRRRLEVDYDRWLGPAPQVPFDPQRFHQHWRWFSEYGSGELGNQGVHWLDVARWGVGVELPTRVTAQGLRLNSDAVGDWPDTLSVQYEYPEVTLTWEHRLWSDYGMEGRSTGVALHGTNGTLVVDRGGWKVYGVKDGAVAAASSLLEPHLDNFLECIRTRQIPAADLRTGCVSSDLCHLGNEAFRQQTTHQPAV
ncbi:MAG: Gfo/Idh/MocA family oxidoreductase, partial [Planctomycetaceae bacterium]|nr:Gfo/Idh/MocA family oxidoreductase [Planctomycetaceae bacterium]